MKKPSVSYGLVVILFLTSSSVLAQSTDWQHWFESQIRQHPDIIAAREQLRGSKALAEATEQPLYNPELSSELERHGEEANYLVGVSQTIDWWDRRGARKQQAGSIQTAAEAYYRQQLLDKTAEALVALIHWHSANRAAVIAQEQENQLNTLLKLAEKRQKAGDMGSVDAELTFLSLSQQFVQVAEMEVALQKATIHVSELLPQWTPERGGVPTGFWPTLSADFAESDLLTHPAVARVRAQWQSLIEASEVTKLAAKADPTIGVSAGRNIGETFVGMNFSIPLNVRNDFSAETRVAKRSALHAKARFEAVYRKQRFDFRAAQASWQRYQQQYQRWQVIVQGRVQNSAELLEQQWRSGDLSTTNYLLALNQRAQSLLAGIELEKQTRLALLDVLFKSGQLMQPIPDQRIDDRIKK